MPGFTELLGRFERTVSVLGRSQSTFSNYSRHVAVVLSKQEVWQMLSGCKLLKHKILIGLLYGCGLRCLEVRNLRLCDLDFDRKQLKVVQGKGKKDRYLPLSDHLIRSAARGNE